MGLNCSPLSKRRRLGIEEKRRRKETLKKRRRIRGIVSEEEGENEKRKMKGEAVWL